MSLNSALNAGVSGLQGQSTRLATISDNVANSATTGYKRSDVDFTTLFINSGSSNTFSAGGAIANTRMDISQQGIVTGSSVATHMGIVGDGAFVVTPGTDGAQASQHVLTRAGAFQPDADGFLRNTAGFYLQGFRLNPDGTYANGAPSLDTFGSLEPVNVFALNNVGSPTTEIGFKGNLPSQFSGTPGTNFQTSVEYFSPLGDPQTMDLVWSTTAVANQYQLEIFDGATSLGTMTVDFNDGIGPNVPAGAPGTYTFVPGPNLTALDPTTGTLDITLVSGQTLQLTLGGEDTLEGITQFSTTDYTAQTTRDGSRAGRFLEAQVQEDGTMIAIFDNGAQLPIFEIPVATVPNENGLQPQDGNVFRLSNESGVMRLNRPGEGAAGAIEGGALEGSNVDIANEITAIIETQRAYSTNATVIRTADEMLEEATRIKR